MAFPIIPNEGKICFGNIVINAIQGGRLNSTVFLFTNDFTPDANTVAANLIACTAGGLTGQGLPVPIDSGIDIVGVDVRTFPNMTFTATGSGLPITLYGYFITCTDPFSLTTKILWCQRFATPQVAINAGDKISFMPTLGINQCG